MDNTFNRVSFRISRVVTNTYSTSFSIGAGCLHQPVRNAIYSIYGFVRLADEIVDSFHGYDREALLEEFTSQYYRALKDGISIISSAGNADQRRIKLSGWIESAILRLRSKSLSAMKAPI